MEFFTKRQVAVYGETGTNRHHNRGIFDRGYLMHLVGGSDSREEILQYAESMYYGARRGQRIYVVDNMTGEVIFDKVKE